MQTAPQSITVKDLRKALTKYPDDTPVLFGQKVAQ